ncbi:MAG: aminotransferase class I/II-fold pyridoxal phosphate-dependent enzyme, partial [Opitutales bacterium]
MLFSAMGQRLREPVITNLMTRALEDPEMLSLAAGFTDNNTLPLELVAKATQSLLGSGADPEVLQYGTNQGRAGLRKAVAERGSNQFGESAEAWRAKDILVSQGAQQALYLAMQTLADPGDFVLVERPTYFVFLEMLAGLGIEARSIPADAGGNINFSALRKLLSDWTDKGEIDRLKAVYHVSYYSNPSGRSLSDESKRKLGKVFAEINHPLPVIEDAAYRDLYHTAPFPAPSILSIEEYGD